MGFIRGLTGADAATDAAGMQDEAANRAIALTEETRDLARADMQPFTQFGADQMGNLNNMLTNEGQAEFLQGNPLFGLAEDNLNRQTMAAQASRGRLGTGDTLNQVSMNTLLAGQPLLDRQTNNLFNAVNMGQASAAGQANTSLTSGSNISNLLTQQGNAQAAGRMGAHNAQAGFFGGLANLGATIWGAK